MKDCILCGAKGSVYYRDNITEKMPSKNGGEIIIYQLEGYFCKQCGEGFYTEESNRKFNEAIKLPVA